MLSGIQDLKISLYPRALVDKKMSELMDAAHMGRGDAAVLAAVNIADELYKAQESAENLRRQLREAASKKP